MYGLINIAVEAMVIEKFGAETWERIKERADLDVDVFLSVDSYPDAMTYRLVAAASETLNLTQAQVLEAFGEYWITYTRKTAYGPLLKSAGSNLTEFMGNLDSVLHNRVGLTLPNLRPPSFRCTDVTPESFCVHYHSERQGLAPMVVGLIKGLGNMFQTQIEVTQIADRVQGADHDQFLVRYLPAEAETDR